MKTSSVWIQMIYWTGSRARHFVHQFSSQSCREEWRISHENIYLFFCKWVCSLLIESVSSTSNFSYEMMRINRSFSTMMINLLEISMLFRGPSWYVRPFLSHFFYCVISHDKVIEISTSSSLLWKDHDITAKLIIINICFVEDILEATLSVRNGYTSRSQSIQIKNGFFDASRFRNGNRTIRQIPSILMVFVFHFGIFKSKSTVNKAKACSMLF